MNKSESITALAVALAKAQAGIEGAKKDSSNPFFHSTYADLASVWDACREPLTSNGLSVVQLPGKNEGGHFMETILLHSSGEFISSILPFTPGYTDKEGEFVALNDCQALGSAITYARRYGLQAIVGIAPVDDDGEGAMGRQQEQPKRQYEPRQKAAAKEKDREEDNLDMGEIKTWKDTEVHFGKNKGRKLGELSAKQVLWYFENGEQQKSDGKAMSAADVKLHLAASVAVAGGEAK